MRECVITGAGIVSPLGVGLAANYAALFEGRSGIRPLARFNGKGFPVHCAGEAQEGDLRRDGHRAEAMAMMALQEALENAGLTADTELAGLCAARRRAVSFAVGKPTLDLETLARASFLWADRLEPAAVLRRMPEWAQERREADPAMLTRRLAQAAGADGPRYCSYTACASGNDSIGLGKRLIERGQADVVVAGATDSQVHPLGMLEFELLNALSHEPAGKACRPFDRERSGFVVGEGAAVVVLESVEHAARHESAPGFRRVRLAGYGSSLDSYGLTKCHPQGRGAIAAMRGALADGGLEARAVGYLNAHGTGTLLNDAAEATAVQRVWGEAAKTLPVSSTKAMTGHLVTAASAVEAVFTLLALQHQFLPPNLNYEHFDPDCDLQIVACAGQRARLGAAMSNGFGFGGQNSSLVLTLPGENGD